VKELVDYAKANPGKLNFASPGEGSGAHLAGELLNIEAGIQTTHIPYKGMAPAVTDLLAGNVQMMFAGISTVLQHVNAGKLVAIAVASSTRLKPMPSVPTVSESGIPDFDVTSWYGLVVPAGTRMDIVATIRRDLVKVLGDPQVVEKLTELGLIAIGNRPEDFNRMIQAETAKWSAIIKKANIKPQS